MAGVEVVDALEDILRKEGVYDEIKQTLFLAVNSTMKKQKPILKNAKVKEFGSTTDGETLSSSIFTYLWLLFLTSRILFCLPLLLKYREILVAADSRFVRKIKFETFSGDVFFRKWICKYNNLY